MDGRRAEAPRGAAVEVPAGKIRGASLGEDCQRASESHSSTGFVDLQNREIDGSINEQ